MSTNCYLQNMLCKILYYFLLLFVGLQAYAQINIPDSVHNDYEKGAYLLKLAKQTANFDSSLYILNNAIDLAKKSNKDSLLLKAMLWKSKIAADKGNYNDAIKYSLELNATAKYLKNDYYLFRGLSQLGKVYSLNGDAETGLQQKKEALKVAEKMQDSLLFADALNNIGDAFKALDFEDIAKKYFLRALAIYDKIDAPEEEKMITYKNLARVETSYNKINYYFDKALTVVSRKNNPLQLAYFYLSKGDAMSYKKYYKNALFSFEKSLKISDSLHNDVISKISLIGIGKSYNGLGDSEKAIKYLKKALKYKVFNLKNHYILLDELSKSYNSLKKYKEAYLTTTKMINLKDSLNSVKINNAFAEFDTKYETKKKEAQIAKQKLKIELEEKRKNLILFGSIALLLLSGIIFQWYINRQRRKNKEKELLFKLDKEKAELALKLKKAESKNLKELNEAKSRFFTNIAHELRTPLTLIMGPLQDVIGKIKGDNKETLKIAHSNSKKLLTLVNDILELSTLEAGTPDLNKTEMCLFAFLKRIFYSYESYAKIRQLNTTLELPNAKDIMVYTDGEKLEKILNNLLSNAFKYSETGDTVKFLVELKENTAFISVQDSGVGISDKDIEHIFDRYYQGTNAENLTGTGIGLSFANRLAILLGGNISVVSKKGKGSTFTLQLPLEIVSEECPDEASLSSEIEETESTPYIVNSIFDDKPKVLIVEDNFEMQKYLKGILKQYFYVEFAKNGFEGLKKLKKSKYDLVSSDVMMPGMDGFVFREEINKNIEWKNIPFILLTARSLKEDKIRGFRLGVDDYITKPFNASEYITRINNLIKNKKERDKYYREVKEDIKITNGKSSESEIIKELEKIILENIDNSDFKTTDLALKVNCSPRNLSRIIKKNIGITPVNLILEVRLQKAYQLLKSNKYKTVSEVRYEVGIENASYFSRKFVERFGVKPKEVQ